MNIQRIIGTVFLVCGLVYAFFLGREMVRNKEKLKNAKGNFSLICALQFAIYFLCTIGVSDFLLNTLMIKKLRLADDRSLPSCLIAATIVPGAFIAFSYLKAENSVDALTLVLWMICLAIGGVLGGRAVSSMDGAVLKKIMGYALIFSMAALIVKMAISSGSSGSAPGLSGAKLMIMCAACVGIGFINMMGVPCKPAATALLLLLGLSPVATLTLVLVLGCIIPMSGGVSIVKAGMYNRKMVLAAMTAGSVASILGVLMAISMNQLVLNILLLFVMLIAIISIFKK
ncbi:MAG: hypothetical protein IJM17_07160 [Firmicutes bacterium]|nr:hypothetical protein [Bacillota bacterium]